MKTKKIVPILFLAFFSTICNLVFSQAPYQFKIGMMCGTQYKTNPSTGLPYITQTIPSTTTKTSAMNVLNEDGFNITHDYTVPNQWWFNNAIPFMENILTLTNANGMKTFVGAKDFFAPTYTVCPNTYQNDYNDFCLNNAHVNYDLFIDNVYKATPWQNYIWGYQISEEPEYFHPAASPCDINTQYNIEVPPMRQSDAIGYYRNTKGLNNPQFGENGQGQKIASWHAVHGGFIDPSMPNDNEGCYKSTDYFSSSLPNKEDVFFEGSYFNIQFRDWSSSSLDYNNPNGHYLGKFKSINYGKNQGLDVHAVVAVDFSPNSSCPVYKEQNLASCHTNLLRPNANQLWFTAYTSIIHGANGIWFWGLPWVWQMESGVPPYIYDSPTNKTTFSDNNALNQFERTTFPKYYQYYISNLSKELRYLVNNGFISTDPATIIYTKTDATDPNCILPASSTYLPSSVSSVAAEDVFHATQCYPYSGTIPTYTNYHRDEPYGLRYTIRTNGTDVIMIVTNPSPIPVTNVTFNFSNVTNTIIRNATAVESWFDDGSITNINDYNYKVESATIHKRSGTVDLTTNQVLKKYNVLLTNKTLTQSFGPFDVKVYKFVSSPPTYANGWSKVWSNYGSGWINGVKVETFDQFVPGDFDGDGTDELLCIQKLDNNAWATILKYKNTNGVWNWNWEWSNYGSGYIGTHQIKAADKFIVGNFEGDAREELFCINGYDNNAYARMLLYTGGNWQQRYTNNGNGMFGAWGIKSFDKYVAGDFWGDSHKELLCVQGLDNNAWAAIKNYSGTDWQWGCNNNANGFIGNWGIKAMDEYKVGDLNGDGKQDDLLCVQKGGYYASIYKNYNASNCAWNWTALWENGGSGGINGVGNPVKVDDKILMGNIDADNKEEMMFINTCAGCNYAVTEELNSSNQPTWMWSNQNGPSPSNYLYDWPINDASGSDVNYLFIKPNPTDTKYLMAFRKYGCNDYLVNMYKTTGVNYKETATSVSNEYIPEQHIINIFPNPSKGEFAIDVSPLSDSNYKIEICNIYGQLVKTIASKAGNNSPYVQVDLTDVSSGVYFVKIISDAITETGRITINR